MQCILADPAVHATLGSACTWSAVSFADAFFSRSFGACFNHTHCAPLLLSLLHRCRSVSMVPPAYYAQLAAERGQVLSQGRSLLGDKEPGAAAGGSSSSSSGAVADGTADGTAAAAPATEGVGDVPADFDVRVNVRLGGSMYYV